FRPVANNLEVIRKPAHLRHAGHNPLAIGVGTVDILPCKPRVLRLMKRINGSLLNLKFLVFLLSAGAGCFVFNSEVAAQITLVPTNAVWRYLDYGVDMGITFWRSVNFVE